MASSTSILNTLKQSFQFTFTHWKTLLKLLWLPLILAYLQSFFLKHLGHYLRFPAAATQSTEAYHDIVSHSHLMMMYVSLLLNSLLPAFFACLWQPKWLRFLYNPASSSSSLYPLDKKIWPYFKYTFIWLALGTAGVNLGAWGVNICLSWPLSSTLGHLFPQIDFVFIAQSTQKALAMLAHLMVIYPLLRVSFVFPALIMGKKISFRQSWALSKPVHFSLLGYTLGMWILYYSVLYGLKILIASSFSTHPFLLRFYIFPVLGHSLFLFTLAAFFYGHFIFYRSLKPKPRP